VSATKTKSRGEANSQARLDETDVRAIRLLAKHEIYTWPQLAALFRVSRETVAKIVTRQTWRHLK